MSKNRNEMLLEFGYDWMLDGDLIRCRACKRAHIASRENEDFVHATGCVKWARGGRPWARLVAILMQPSGGAS